MTDVVVVGNGAIGLSTALELRLRDPSLTVEVVGPRNRIGGASGAAGALLGCFGEVTKYTFRSAAGAAKFSFGRRAHELWPAHLARLREFSDASIETASDTYVLLNARSGQLDTENFAAITTALDDSHTAYEEAEGVEGLYPRPGGRPLRILRLPDEGAIDSTVLLAALESACKQAGVRTRPGLVARIEAGSRSAISHMTDGTTLHAGHVVVAAGAFTSPLLRGIDARVQPVLAGSGVAYVTERVMGPGFRSVVRSVNRAGSCGLHVIPLGGSLEYYGATNVLFAAPETRPHLGVCHFLIDCAIDQLDQRASYSRIVEQRFGNRPVTIDSFPLLGRLEGAAVTVLSGTYRDGLHASPAIARDAAEEITTGRARFDAIFAPNRPPIQEFTIEESITEFVDQQVASAAETGVTTAQFIASEDLTRLFRPLAERFYEQAQIGRGLHPDLLAFACLSHKRKEDVDELVAYLRTVRP